MRLTRFTDYAIRLLVHLACRREERCTVAEVAALERVPEHHLGKVAHALARAGYVEATRGRTGGIRLAAAPSSVVLGKIVRLLEPCETLAHCGDCVRAADCRLPGPLGNAMAAFLAELDAYTLADLLPSAPREAAPTPAKEFA